MNLTDINVVRSLMGEFGINFQKKFGQNFLISASVPERIAAESGGGENDCVLEIGPGIGTLTTQLCQTYKKVVCVEIDSGLIPVLQKTLADFDNVTVINEDIMKSDIHSLTKEHFSSGDIYVCANLPYYITSPIIMKLLESRAGFSALTFMVQKEVAARFTSSPGCAEYGAVTAAINYYGEVKRLFTVPAGCFMPAPKVDSAVIKITPHKVMPVVPKNEELFFKVIKASFGNRRKTLVNGLHNSFPKLSKEELKNCLSECGLPADIRGETLNIKEFCNISDKISQKDYI